MNNCRVRRFLQKRGAHLDSTPFDCIRTQIGYKDRCSIIQFRTVWSLSNRTRSLGWIPSQFGIRHTLVLNSFYSYRSSTVLMQWTWTKKRRRKTTHRFLEHKLTNLILFLFTKVSISQGAICNVNVSHCTIEWINMCGSYRTPIHIYWYVCMSHTLYWVMEMFSSNLDRFV